MLCDVHLARQPPYSGDSSHLTSTSALTQTVNQAATALAPTSQAATVAPCDPRHDRASCRPVPAPRDPVPPGRPSGVCSDLGHGDGHDTVSGAVYLPSGPDTSILCQAMTFTATLSVTPPGAGAPTGILTFADGSTVLGTATVNAEGSASLTTDQLPVGPRAITATYGGSADFRGSSGSLTQHVEYIFVGLLPPLDRNLTVDAGQTVPIAFMLLDAQGRPVRGATAALLVNGKAAVPQGRANKGDAFREAGDRYQYDLKLSDQGVRSGTADMAITLDDGTTHDFTLTVRPRPDRH